MRKAKRLIESLRTSPVQTERPGIMPWHDKLAGENPKLMAEIDETIDAWLANDEELRRVCENQTSLARWLLPHVQGVKSAPSIVRYIAYRRQQKGAA